VLLLVEGPSDEKVLPILARRLRSGVRFTAKAVGKGDLLSAQKVEVHIRFATAHQRGIDKAVLCIDSECTPTEETRARLDAVAREVGTRFPSIAIRGVVVDHSLEGWLLCDRQALAQFLGQAEQRLRYGNAENECRPAALMGRLFKQARRDFVKTDVLPRLAEIVDAQRISQGSPTFETFRRILVQG
jgi:hypothetical protein